MPDPCTTYVIDNAGPNADGSYDVVVNSFCNRVEVRENFDSASPPTADLVQYRPKGSATPVKVPMGTSAIFTPFTGQKAGFVPGQIAGSIKTRLGSITAAQIESTQI